jgi:Trk K+ transport system NAD-binding subunit
VNESGIREQYQCMLAGFQDKGQEQLALPHATRIIRSGDILWIVGERAAIEALWAEEFSK